MGLKKYDGKRVRITDPDGEKFEGIAEYLDEEYCMHEFGREEQCLQIVNFLFFVGDIGLIESLEESGYSEPYGTIELQNLRDGFDSVYDELFCEEDEHVCRMLECLKDLQPDISENLADALLSLLKTDISDRCRALAAELLKNT